MSDLLGLLLRFKLNLPRGIKPRYNIAPAQDILAIINDGGYQAVSLKWGLVPFWSKDATRGLINARAETVEQKPSFKQSLQSRRCLIPADGFYEWGKEGGRKKPYRITLKDKSVFVFAGLWDIWRSPGGEVISTCAIITTVANTLISSLHNRMPVILPADAEKAWLDRETAIPALKSLLKPYPAVAMESYAISSLVNNPRHDNPEVLRPV